MISTQVMCDAGVLNGHEGTAMMMMMTADANDADVVNSPAQV